MLRWISFLGLCGLAAAAALPAPEPQSQTPVFQSGTRLVEVEVVVRGKDGPVKGLTKDDFKVLDQGKPQRIDVFRAGPASESGPAIPLAPGVVSNRVDRKGEALPSATAVLFDQLNVRLDFKGYERQQVLNFMRSLHIENRVAIYSLGKNLHVLQDFTDDPQRLLAAVTKLDQGRDLMPANVEDALFDLPVDMEGNIVPLNSGDPITDGMYKDSIMNMAGITAQVNGAINDQTTIEALKRIISHLSGMPGRRNLIWVKEAPTVPPAVMGMLQRANITLYPVMIRTVTTKGNIFAVQHAAQDLAAATGGASFNDAGDLHTAMKTAEEDSLTAYTLGYYPAEDVLDGKFHRLSVTVAGMKNANLEVRYRPGYVASKQPLSMAAPSTAAAINEFIQTPLDATAIGLTGEIQADPDRPDSHRVRVTIDLHDVRFERQGEWNLAAIEVTYALGGSLRLATIRISLTDSQLMKLLQSGYVTNLNGVDTVGESVRVLVRDPATGAAGSLKIPVR
ncbi:MAG TPA: VWA domain-containing protein [Bryobacteraceae bacterium]|jgi:VWFA-related protein